jgi:hypothetical protein
VTGVLGAVLVVGAMLGAVVVLGAVLAPVLLCIIACDSMLQEVHVKHNVSHARSLAHPANALNMF